MTLLNSDNSFLQGTLAKVTFTPAKDFNLPSASGQLAQHQCRYTVYDLKINDNPLGDPIVVDEGAPQVGHWINIFPEPDPSKPGNYFFNLLIPDYQNDKMFELEIRAKDDIREQYTDSLTDVIYTFYNNIPRITIVSLEWDSTFTKQVVNYSVLDPGFIRPLNLEEIEKNVSLKNNFENKYLLEVEDALGLPSSLSLKLLSYESSLDVKETDLTNLEWNSDTYLTKNRKITLSTPHTNPDINLHFQIKSSILNASFLSKIENITGAVILPAQKTSFTIGNANIRANMPKNAPSNGNTAAGMFSHSEYNKIEGDAERGNSIGLYDHYIKPGENIVRDEPSIGFMSAAHKELAKIQYIEDENGGNLLAFIWDKSNPVATPKRFWLGGGGVSSSLKLNQDLNNITEIGNYNTPSSTIADSILNKPEDFSGPFHLQISQAENLIQRIVFEGAPSSFFSRVQNKDGTWTEWTPVQFIDAVRYEYLQTTNATTPPSSTSSLWSSEKPEEIAGKYIWQRIKLEFTLGQRIYSDPTMISPDSVQIPNRYYRYSLDDDLNTAMQESSVGMKYIGVANTFDKTAPTKKSAYEWTRFTGYDGSDGTDWTIGSDGMWYKNGVKTSDKAIGVDGSPGAGIKEHLEYYLATSQGTGVTTDHAVWDWTETPQQIDENNKFLWNYSTTEYTNGVVSTESPVIIGSYGVDGRGIEGVKEYYLISSLKTGVTHSSGDWSTIPPSVDKTNPYLWNYEEIFYTDDTSSKTDPALVGVRGDDGEDGYTPIKGVDYFDGVDGQDGTGITSAVVTYQNHDNGTTAPTGTWTEDPNPVKGQYLWTRTVTTYTDTTSVPTYSVAYQAVDGASGTDGRGIVSTVVEYVKSTTTTMPSTGWSTTRPTVNKGEYLWTRTTINYTSGSPSVSISNSYVPTDGQSGTSAYLWVRYSQNADGEDMTDDPTNAEYIGIATTLESEPDPEAPTNNSLYTWSLIKGRDGVRGETGQDGKTSYLHIKYSNDGGENFTGNGGEDVGEWIGTYVDFNEEDELNVSFYTWNKVKGDKGDTGTSVSSVVEWYLATNLSSGVTTGTDGWKTTIQTMTPTNKYLWNYEVINFSDGSSSPTIPVIMGVYGDKGETGATGRSITGITEHYLTSSLSTGVTRTTSGWKTTMQTTTPTNKYLWNYETITWSSGITTTYTDPIIIGVHGDKGDKGDKGESGRSITSVDVQYARHASSTSAPTSGWSTTAPDWKNGEYIWSKTVTTYSTGDPTESTPACITGQAGDTGATGRGVSSIVEQFYLSTSKTNQVGGSWSTTMPTWEPRKYIWTRSFITYTSGTPPTSTTEPLVSSEWEAVNEIEIGGRNLLRNSGEVRSTNRTIIVNTYEDLHEYVGEEVMVYFDLKINEGGVLRSILSAYPYQNNGVSVADSTNALPTEKGVWQRFGRKTYIKDWGDNNPAWTNGAIAFHDNVGANDYEIRNIKIERGNKATDWTPAPEDIDAQIVSTREIIEARLDDTDHTILAIANDQTVSPLEEADLQNLITQVDVDTLILTAKNDGVHDVSFLTTAGDNLKNFISGVLSTGSYAEINPAEFNDLYQTYKNEEATLESLIRDIDEQRYTDLEAGQTTLGTRIGSYEEQLRLESDLISMYIDKGYGLEQAMTLAKDELVFYIDNQRRAWIGLNGLNADNATIGQSARIGNHEFQKYGTDYTTINWTGGD